MSIILKMCFAVFLALLVSVSVDSATMMKRETQTENQTQPQTPPQTTVRPVKICDTSLSCGWAVYTAFTREIRYFMKNSCDCPENQNCVRVDDDPGISAYIYKCRNKRTTVAPQTTE